MEDVDLLRDVRDFLKAQSNLLTAYRIGSHPTEATLDTLRRLGDVPERLDKEIAR